MGVWFLDPGRDVGLELDRESEADSRRDRPLSGLAPRLGRPPVEPATGAMLARLDNSSITS